VYINAVADSVTLYLQQEFYKVIFKIKHKLHIASGSAPPKEKFWLCTCVQLYNLGQLHVDLCDNLDVETELVSELLGNVIHPVHLAA
jgi:hypothetical protein